MAFDATNKGHRSPVFVASGITGFGHVLVSPSKNDLRPDGDKLWKGETCSGLMENAYILFPFGRTKEPDLTPS